MSNIDSNRPVWEIYAEAGEAWADAEAAASLLEDTKSAFLSQKILDLGDMSHNKAEALVKASPWWLDYVTKTVAARKNANKLKVRLETIKMHQMQMTSDQATERVQARL